MTPEQIAERLRRAGDTEAADALGGAVALIRSALDGEAEGCDARLRAAALRVVEVRYAPGEWSELSSAIADLASVLGWVSR